ncbi:MAG: selB [Firmicutes bacterium]|nr:selB [Bacillota bacterium]
MVKHVIIGTAGHVDHGKTALIRALTGIDTDRLQEEKRRGISIDLGFAALELTNDIHVGFVDVPGHERFLKNMLAGTGGIDAVVLVIAADEGVMPQTREHLAMLQLYGLQHGMVVLTKIDKVDPEWLELVEEDIREFLQSTFLADAPFYRVSSTTGEGVETFRTGLASLGGSIPARDKEAPFRMWIDRVFVSKGHGVVATGSVLSGTIIPGDSLKLVPSETGVRVRGLEVHGMQVDSVSAGQRAAINLSGAEIREVTRGMALVAKDCGQVSANWDVVVDWYEDIPDAGVRVRLHIGTAEYIGRLHPYKDSAPNLVRLLLEKPLGAMAGERGILRLYSPQHLLGSAALISPGRRSRKQRPYTAELAHAQAVRDLDQIVTLLPAREERLMLKEEIQVMAGCFNAAKIDACLRNAVQAGTLELMGPFYFSKQVGKMLTQEMQTITGGYHRQFPHRFGISRESLRQKLRLAEKEFEALIQVWETQQQIQAEGAEIALPGHAKEYFSWRQKMILQLEAALPEADIADITPELVTEKLQLRAGDIASVYEALFAAGMLVRLGDIVVYRKTIQYIAKIIQQHFAEKTTLTVAELRDKLNTSRKFALAILDFLDMHKYTIRDGDVRRKGREVKYLSE